MAAHIKALDKDFDLSNAQLSKDYYYASLPLCVIDAVFSIGVRYESVQRTVRSWCEFQNPVWEMYGRPGKLPPHGLDEFVELLKRHDVPYLAEHVFQNRQRTSTRSGILKAEAVYRFARALLDTGINTLGDTEDTTRNEEARKKVKTIPGQRSGISFNYFLMLAGSDDFVKADRMLCRFVSAALHRPVEPPEAQALVTQAAHHLKQVFPRLTPRLLDYVIWGYQRRLK
ncbi:MAG: hypothetical protein KGJ66_08895 [Alphaproteobacteria bacterium]|nr:hypothetical protein [Alphaproteobacteria bacterium]